MKTLKILLFTTIILITHNLQAQVFVSNDATSAEASAMLEVKSTEKGFLPPRLTESQRDAIASPASGLWVWCSDCGGNGEMQIYNGSSWTNMAGDAPSTSIPNVTNPTTGKTWMDRNLGASRVAQSSTDSEAYGDLYQWGRGSDGHESRSSGTTSSLSNSDTPGHGDFITVNSGNYDWRSPQNDNLWQGVNGTNNPCPSGYRLPTIAEWEAERTSWSSNNAAGAFASPLKLPVAGYRYNSDGTLFSVGSSGFCWSSTVDGRNARQLYFFSSNASMYSVSRADGYSVRCLKD